MKRIEWVDVYKGIMIILVVIGHATNMFNAWIYQFHMAAFFFISGYLTDFEKNDCFGLVLKKFFSIILPMLTLGTVGIFLNYYLNSIGLYDFLFGSSFIGINQSFKQWLYEGDLYVQYWGTFWFFGCIFCVEVFHAVLFKIMHRKIRLLWLAISFVLFLLGYYFVENGIIPFRQFFIETDLICIAQMYFLVGFLCRCLDFLNYVDTYEIRRIFVLISSIFIAFWGALNKIYVDFPSRNFHNSLPEIVVSLASIYIVIYLSKNIYRCSIYFKNSLKICGKNSLGIMAFHLLFFKIFMCFLYIIGLADHSQIINVVLPQELQYKYWVVLTFFSVLCSLTTWHLLTKNHFISVLLGQDKKNNVDLAKKIDQIYFVQFCNNKIDSFIESFWDVIESNMKKKDLTIIIFALTFLVLFFIPLYKTGIINNDELQARALAMQGIVVFYKTEFFGWIAQGRLLSAPINSFTKYLGFLGAQHGTFFRFVPVLLIILSGVSYGRFLYKLFRDKCFSIFSTIILLACMPITFEHTSPNSFVGFLVTPFILLFISLNYYIRYLEKKNCKSGLVSMCLFFIAMSCYEAFVTFLPLYLMVAYYKIGFNNNKNKLEFYVYPIFTAIIFLTLYFLSARFFPSGYGGNQLFLGDIRSSCLIIFNLFLACIPGYYTMVPKYIYLKSIYNSLGFINYLRILFFVLCFSSSCYILLKEKTVEIYQNTVECFSNTVTLKTKLLIIFCGVLYMIFPSIPNALAKMYQGIVGFNKSFVALPVTFFEYFAAVFVISYVIWEINKYVGRKFYIVVTIVLSLLVLNIQYMNEVFSNRQAQDFKRLKLIEDFMNTDAFKKLGTGAYYAKDLFQQRDALHIHESYWTDYCNKILGKRVLLNLQKTDQDSGAIYYNDDNFLIIDGFTTSILSKDKEKNPKYVKASNTDVILDRYDNEKMDRGFYVYTMKTINNSYSGYRPLVGWFGDGWIASKSNYEIITGKEGLINGKLYYPGKNIAGKNVNFYIDNELVKSKHLDGEITDFHIKTNKATYAELTIECNFVYDEKNNLDPRPLTIIMAEMNVK